MWGNLTSENTSILPGLFFSSFVYLQEVQFASLAGAYYEKKNSPSFLGVAVVFLADVVDDNAREVVSIKNVVTVDEDVGWTLRERPRPLLTSSGIYLVAIVDP